ncbi:MAG TPA: MBL fold metallo-hydrolase [Armatimonadota bacterium]|nr:MBL fold metallo-hydrolase [Armatimonadota bacterium]
MNSRTNYWLAALCVAVVGIGANRMSISQPLGEGHYLQFLGTKAGTEYVEYAPADERSIFGYAMLSVPPNTVIDFAEDARDKMRHWGVSEEGVDNILFTHSHFDHYDGPTVLSFARDRWQEFGRKTHAFAPEAVFAALTQESDAADAGGFLTVTEVVPGDRIPLADGVAATALPSSHWTAPAPIHYLLEFHGRKILYAVDAAALRDEDFDALVGHRLDAAIIDCTYLDAEVDPEKSGHMNYAMVREQMSALTERGCATDATPCYITHLITIDHRQGAAAAREFGLRMPHDGFRILFP